MENAELYKNQIRNMLMGKLTAGETYHMLIELANECKEIAIQNHIDKEEEEREKHIPLDPIGFRIMENPVIRWNENEIGNEDIEN